MSYQQRLLPQLLRELLSKINIKLPRSPQNEFFEDLQVSLGHSGLYKGMSRTARFSKSPFSSRAAMMNTPPRVISSTTSTLEEDADNDEIRLPRNVQAIYLAPLRRKAEYGVPSCDLQLRSYSVRNLEFFSDFALRAAYYLKLPAFGPVPLPRITERWTVPRSNFVFKKSQENFERITLRRLIQIKDGNPETVELWLAFLRKHAYHGVGMKANIWNYEELGVGKTMDVSMESLEATMEPKWAHFGRKRSSKTAEKVVELMNSEKFRLAAGGNQPMMRG